jgi:hypothetical protein
MPKIALLIPLVFILGCATMSRGISQGFQITSAPSGASVVLSNGESCITPCALNLPRRPGFDVSVSLEGYKTVNTNVVSQRAELSAAGTAGNMVMYGLPGVALDTLTGAMNELFPNPLHVDLEAQ